MQDRPNIGTAIPKRRYQVGDYSATVLGEVETTDPRQYRYILAMVPMGQRTPTLYSPARQLHPESPPRATTACASSMTRCQR